MGPRTATRLERVLVRRAERRRRANRVARPDAAPRAARPGWATRARAAALASPGYALAAFVHLLALFVLSLFTIAGMADDGPRLPVEVRLVAVPEVVVPPPPRPVEDAPPLELPALDPVPVPTPTDAAPGVPGPDASDLVAAARAIGLGSGRAGGGGGGTGEGGGGGPGGASRAGERARHAGLEWLVRHRAPDGGWGEVDANGREHLPARSHAARTGLALLCFLCAGHGPDDGGPYGQVVARALDWLSGQVRRAGTYGPAYEGYEQGICTLALAEALRRRRTPELERAVRRAVTCIEAAQDDAGGWRYRPGTPGDTSITGWMVLALKAAAEAGVIVSDATWTRARAYLESVSNERGRTYYLEKQPGTRAMDATGLFLRLLLGEPAGTPRNQRAVALTLEGGLEALIDQPGGWNDPGGWDPYTLYYSALALHQVGGAPWHELNTQMREALVERQLRGGCEDGAWEGGGRVDGLLLGTTFATLTLETYFRYGQGEEAAPAEPAPPVVAQAPSPAERQLDRARRQLAALERGGAGVEGCRTAFQEALHLASREPAADVAREQRAEALAGLVRCSALAGDGAAALAHADEYLTLVGRAKADRGVLAVRRLERLRLAAEAVEAATRTRAKDALAAAWSAFDRARGAADDERAARGGAAGLAKSLADGDALLARLRGRLVFASDADGALSAAMRTHVGAPGDAPPDDGERFAALAALERAGDALARVARGEADEAAMRAASADLDWVRSRELARRLPPDQAPDFARALATVGVARLQALLARGRDLEVLEGASEVRRDAPDHAARVDAVERAALMRRWLAGDLAPEHRPRLLRVLAGWIRDAPAEDRGTPWARVGQLMAENHRPRRADQAFRRALQADPAGAVEVSVLRLGLARARGDHEAVEEHLTELDRLGHGARLEAQQARADLLRAGGRHREAIALYLGILRAVPATEPAWWDTAYATAETYVAADAVAEARRFLDGVRRRDTTFGGDAERRRRFVDLMARLDARR